MWLLLLCRAYHVSLFDFQRLEHVFLKLEQPLAAIALEPVWTIMSSALSRLANAVLCMLFHSLNFAGQPISSRVLGSIPWQNMSGSWCMQLMRPQPQSQRLFWPT